MLLNWFQPLINFNRHPSQLCLNMLDTLLLLVRRRISKYEVHIFKGLKSGQSG